MPSLIQKTLISFSLLVAFLHAAPLVSAANCCPSGFFPTNTLRSDGTVVCAQQVDSGPIVSRDLACPGSEPECDLATNTCQATSQPPPTTTSSTGTRTNFQNVTCNVSQSSGQRSNLGINTALGCISLDPTGFLSQIVPWSIALAGGMAFFLILLASFQHITAAGNPEQIQAAQEMLTSAIAGLLIIIFATVILKIIGVDILGLNRLGF